MIINWFDMLQHHEEGITDGLECEDALHFGIRSSETPYKWVVLSGTEVLREGEVRNLELKINNTIGPGVYNPRALVRLIVDDMSEAEPEFNEELWRNLRSQLVGEVYDDMEDYARRVLVLARIVLASLEETYNMAERYYIAMTVFELRNFIERYEEWRQETGETPSEFLLRGVGLVEESLQHLEVAL